MLAELLHKCVRKTSEIYSGKILSFVLLCFSTFDHFVDLYMLNNYFEPNNFLWELVSCLLIKKCFTAINFVKLVTRLFIFDHEDFTGNIDEILSIISNGI